MSKIVAMSVCLNLRGCEKGENYISSDNVFGGLQQWKSAQLLNYQGQKSCWRDRSHPNHLDIKKINDPIKMLGTLDLSIIDLTLKSI